MPPTPEQPHHFGGTGNHDKLSSTLDGESVVISGMSGLYPQAHSVEELSHILYDKVNPATNVNSRWGEKYGKLIGHAGLAPDLDLFDAQFFMVHCHLSVKMDIMARKVLEQAYQAIFDAGVNPQHLNGKKVAVYVGCSFSGSEFGGIFDSGSRTGFGITGCSKTMFANRISYWLNTNGPSLTIDEACCSSMAALEQAYLALHNGDCEAAIVCGTHLTLTPEFIMHFNRIISVAKDGKTKSFDENADGCMVSDAINVLFLQKAKNALRVYAQLVHIKNEFASNKNESLDQKFGFYRNPRVTTDFMKRFYEEARVSPQNVEYVEAFGSANPEADKSELEAISEVFCGDRTDPLLVGSVMSNVGFTNAASGITAVTKVLLGYQRGELAGNLHLTSPRQDVRALREGRLRVLTDHQRFSRNYAALNCFSVTGVNAHALLKGYSKPKDLSRYKCSIPRLVTISARQESSVEMILDSLKSRPVDPEELALFHNLHTASTPGHLGRGFIILDTVEEKTVSLSEKKNYFDDSKRPLWFVYSGMGSQWAGMGAQLMRIPIFAAAIERCNRALESNGVDIVHIITSPEENMFDNIQNSFVGIAAMQIGLTDVLLELGLVPDNIIGHSVGELGCAYADGCMTAEEMMISAYKRGTVSLASTFIRGSMAAVGLGYQQIVKICPPEIDVACHNGPESCTISGPAGAMSEFVAQLTSKGVFAKEVPCSNIAYHSRYIAQAGPSLLRQLTSVIKNPKPRSKRWLSTSIPEDRWNEPLAKSCSAEYHTNNLLSPVLFQETCRLIPSNAVLVEVAPHGLLQAILKRSLPSTCTNIALTRRGHKDNALLLLESVGELYMKGYNPNVQVLYPKIEFPVSTETPLLSHLVEWVHSEKWPIKTANYYDSKCITSASCKFIISVHDDHHNYLKGNVMRGNVVYPFASVLVDVWDTLAMYLGVRKRELMVQFHDVHLYVQPILHEQQQLKINVTINKGTGWFEVVNGISKVAIGYIVAVDESKSLPSKQYDTKTDMLLNSEDVYNQFLERDYNYCGEFRSIHSANESLSEAHLVWQDNWVTLLDGMLQLNALRHAHNDVSQPRNIRNIIIDFKTHKSQSILEDGKLLMIANISDIQDYTRCGGIIMQNIKFYNMSPETTPLKLDIPPSCNNIQGSDEHAALVRLQTDIKGKPVTLQSALIGDFNSLHWAESSEANGLGIPVTVHYAGLNSYDVKSITEINSHDVNYTNRYGMDFSGVTKSGDRVMGIVPGGACSSEVCARPELLWPVPAHWSLQDAATVPLAYTIAFYCFGVRAQLSPGARVLVHGGAGALGQAAIAIALASDCQVFTTVSDMRKKLFLRKLFPELIDDNIGNSRDDSFGDLILNATRGQGCDFIISSVKGDLKNISLKCSGLNGITFDTLQIQNQENYIYGMNHMTKQRSYLTVDFSSVLNDKDSEVIEILHRLVSEGIARGYVRPLTRVTYSPDEAPRAFRLLAASQHRGRVLLHLHDSLPPTLPRIVCSSHLSHLLICHGHTVDILVADRLVSRGVRKLHIHCTTSTSHIRYKIRIWKRLGVDVNVSSGNLDESKNVLDLLNKSIQMGPIEGIYVIMSKFSNNTHEEPEMLNHLDLASRNLCPLLKYFAIMTSDSDYTIGLRTRQSRTKDQLPMTQIQIPCLNNMLDNNEDDSMNNNIRLLRGVVDALEVALGIAHPLLVAQQQPTGQPSLLSQLATIADLASLNDAKDSETLKELGLENIKTIRIGTFLRNKYNIYLEEEAIPLLTKARIQELDRMLNRIEFSEISGLKTFFSYVEPDEISITEIMSLPTLANDGITDNEDINQLQLCILPGLEGHHARFRTLCERIQLPALMLHPGFDTPHETIQDTANRYSKILMNTKAVGDHFYLMGYESGSLVALELAAILEDKGLTGTIFFLGCAPEEFKALLEEHLCDFASEEHLQDAIIKHMYALISGGDTLELVNTSWNGKLDECVRSLLGRVSHSSQYTRALIECSLARIVQARRYVVTSRPLRSKLVLLRAASPPSSPDPTTALQAHSCQPVVVHHLTSPLPHATNDTRCAAIINSYLSADILKEFNEKNRCDTYI